MELERKIDKKTSKYVLIALGVFVILLGIYHLVSNDNTDTLYDAVNVTENETINVSTNEAVNESETFELDNKTYPVGTNISVPENISNSTNPFISGEIMENSTNISN